MGGLYLESTTGEMVTVYRTETVIETKNVKGPVRLLPEPQPAPAKPKKSKQLENYLLADKCERLLARLTNKRSDLETGKFRTLPFMRDPCNKKALPIRTYLGLTAEKTIPETIHGIPTAQYIHLTLL